MLDTLEELALFEAAILTAHNPGYVLIGAAEKVYRRDPDTSPHAVIAVGPAEADTVIALLDRRSLLTTGRRPVEIGGEPAHGRDIRPRARTHALVQRWRRDRDRHTRTGEPCRFCHGHGSHPTVELATWTPERGMHRPPAGRTPCAHCQTPTPLNRRR